jgi:N-acyl homoserine lactone hydrolase
VRLYLLNLGRIDADKGRVLTPGSGDGVRITIPVPGYLIETDDGQRILVDSGMHRKHIADPGATFRGTSAEQELKVLMREEDDPVNRLAELGLKPEDVHILVSTHFHFDHAGNHADFGASRILVQRACYEWNKARHDRFTRDLWDQPHLRYELIDGDTEIAPGVEAIETSGHAVGHMSLLVRLPNTGPVLLAIDAISTQENLETDNWGTANNREQARVSAHRLAAIAEREHALLITGHDPDQWSTLLISADFYD